MLHTVHQLIRNCACKCEYYFLIKTDTAPLHTPLPAPAPQVSGGYRKSLYIPTLKFLLRYFVNFYSPSIDH